MKALMGSFSKWMVQVKAVAFIAVMVMSSVVSVLLQPAQAGVLDTDQIGLTFAQPYLDKPVFYAGISLDGGNIEDRGGGGFAVFGPLAVLTASSTDSLGTTVTNRVMSLTFSIGIVGVADPAGTTYGGSLGFGPCWMNDVLCTHAGYKVSSETGKRSLQVMGMLKVVQF